MSSHDQYQKYEHKYLASLSQLLENANDLYTFYKLSGDIKHMNIWRIQLERLKEKEADVIYEIEKRIHKN